MNANNTARLKKRYKKLLSVVDTIACDDGWYDIVSQALDLIQKGCGKSIRIIQIKEKFGRLVILSDSDASCNEEQQELFYRIKNHFWELSAQTCERSGGAGAKLYIRNDGAQLKTLHPSVAVLLGYREPTHNESGVIFFNNNLDKSSDAA